MKREEAGRKRPLFCVKRVFAGSAGAAGGRLFRPGPPHEGLPAPGGGGAGLGAAGPCPVCRAAARPAERRGAAAGVMRVIFKIMDIR